MLDPHGALIYTMVIVSAADRDMTDAELAIIGDIVGHLPAFRGFDRVPWPRPDILHRARKPVFGGAQYDDRIARLRLRQAYGRLVRRADDRGVFAILDRALPSRLLSAFPEGVPVLRVPLVEAARATADFLSVSPRQPGA